MKVIIPLAGFGTRMRPHTWSRPKALMQVAGDTVLGHILSQLSAITTDEVIFVIGYKGGEIERWVSETYPQLDAHYVEQPEQLGTAHALWLCRDFMDEGDVFVAFGDGIINAAYETLADTAADGVALVEEIDDPRQFGVAVVDAHGQVTHVVEKPQTTENKLALVGAYYFKNGRSLKNALDRIIEEEQTINGEYYFTEVLNLLIESSFKMATMDVKFWLDSGNRADMLHTNERLLGLGYGSEDAIDRSYGEDFTVIPPVFIHETAVVDNCVIGPYVTIGKNVRMQRCIVRNSIIDAGSTLENVNLDHSLIGESVTLKSGAHTLFVGDNSRIEL